MLDLEQVDVAKSAGWYKDALNKLSPAARDVGKDLMGIEGEMDDIKTAGQSVAASFKGFFKNIAGSFANMAAMALIMWGIDTFVKQVVQRGDRLDEKADAQRTAWKQTKEEVQSLNDELLANKERIAEINELKAAGSISAQAAATELKTLQETNAALQTQIDLKTMIAEGQKRASESSAVEALTFEDRTVSNPNVTFWDRFKSAKMPASEAARTDEFGYAGNLLDQMTSAAEKVQQLRKEQALLINDQDAWQKKADQIEKWEGKVDDYSSKFLETYGAISTLMDGISGDSPAGKKMIAQFEALTKQYKSATTEANKALAYTPDADVFKDGLLGSLLELKAAATDGSLKIPLDRLFDSSAYTAEYTKLINDLQAQFGKVDAQTVSIMYTVDGFNPLDPETYADAFEKAKEIIASPGGYKFAVGGTDYVESLFDSLEIAAESGTEAFKEEADAIAKIFQIEGANTSGNTLDFLQSIADLATDGNAGAWKLAEALASLGIMDMWRGDKGYGFSVKPEVSTNLNETASSFESAKTKANEYTEAVTKLNTALEQQAKDGHLSADSLNTLGREYLNALDYSGGKFRLDPDKAYDIALAKSQEEYAKALRNSADKQTELNQAIEAYNSLAKDADSATRAAAEAKIEGLRLEVAQWELIMNQYSAMDSLYGRWQFAQGTANGSAVADTIREGMGSVLKEGIKYGKVGTDDYQAALNYVLGGEQDVFDKKAGKDAKAKLDRYTAANGQGYANLYNQLNKGDFFQKDENGELIKDSQGRVLMDASKSVADMAKHLGISKEFMYDLLDMAKDYGVDIDYSSEYWQDQMDKADTLEKKLNVLNALKDKANKDSESGIVDDANTKRIAAMTDEINSAIADVEKLGEAGAATNEQLQSTFTAKIALADEDDWQSIADQFNEYANNSRANGIEIPVTFKKPDGDPLGGDTKGITVNYNLGSTDGIIEPGDINRTVNYILGDTSGLRGAAGNTTQFGPPKPSFTGNANITGNAYVNGVWGATSYHNALVGEKNQEILVDPNTGRWTTVGDHGPEIIRVPKGAIIFNDKQTEGILSGRGAYGRGQAHAGGTAYVNGSWPIPVVNSGSSYKPKPSSSSSSGSSGKSGSKSESDLLSAEYKKDIEMLEHQIDLIEEMLNLYAEGTDQWFEQQQNIIDTYRKALALAQAEYDRLLKAGYDAGSKTMRELADTIIGYQTDIFDATEEYWDAQRENAMDALKHVRDQKQAIVDLKKAHYDLTNAIEDEMLALEKELRIAKDAYPELTEKERAALFGDEDYKELTDKLKAIGAEASSMYSQYLAQIEAVGEDATYELDQITEQMKLQYDLKMKSYETAKAELGVLKAQQNLENVKNNKNVAQLVGGMWVWTYDGDDVKSALEDLSEAEQELAEARRDETQTGEITDLEMYIAEIDGQIEAIDALVFSMDGLAGEVHDLVDTIWTQILANLSETGKSALSASLPAYGLTGDAAKLYDLVRNSNDMLMQTSLYDAAGMMRSNIAPVTNSNISTSASDSHNVYIGEVKLDQASGQIMINALRQAGLLYQYNK